VKFKKKIYQISVKLRKITQNDKKK